MNRTTYIWNSLRHYRRTHAGVVLGAVVAAAVLVGALTVGDSVRHSLTRIALSRLGKTDVVLLSRERFFQADLAARLRAGRSHEAAPILLLNGIALSPQDSGRINDVQVVGVDDAFWRLAPSTMAPPRMSDGECLVNEAFADRLGPLAKGEAFIVRMRKPGGLPVDLALAGREADGWSARLKAVRVLPPESFGRFTLQTTQTPPPTVFLPRSWLSEQLEIPGRANAILFGSAASANREIVELRTQLQAEWRLADAGLRLRPRRDGAVELQSEGVFLDPQVVDAARQAVETSAAVTTYFVNSISANGRSAPYSFVTAPPPSRFAEPLSAGQAAINDWLAKDLNVGVGDSLELTYYAVDSGTRLREESRTFAVAKIVSTEEAAPEDRSLTPDIPGLTEAKNCRDWAPGIPIDLGRIRKKDEVYWDTYGPLPKAYVSHADAGRMWSNRFGRYTAIRFPAASGTPQETAEAILRETDPGRLGFVFQPVRERGLEASRNAVDFGQLFLGLSFFLIVSAVLLTALLFAFTVQFRAEETGTLRALGFLPNRVRMLLVSEGTVLVIAGALVGGAAAVGYNALILAALETIWRDAVRTSSFHLHIRVSSVLLGMGITIVAAVSSMALAIRRQTRRTVRELQHTEWGAEASAEPKGHASLWLGSACIVVALATVAGVPAGQGQEAAAVFFGAAGLLLLGLLGLCNGCLRRLGRHPSRTMISAFSLAARGIVIRRGRSLSCVALVALGVFLVVAVAANRRGGPADVTDPSSASGGYVLWAKTSLPLTADLNTQRGRERYDLQGKLPSDTTVAQLRLHEEDDASCLNLNRVRTPHLAGVDPDLFAQRSAFTFAKCAEGVDPEHPWRALHQDLGPDTIPGVADQATITWGLGKTVGDTIAYTDEDGREFRVRLVGALASSVFQGTVLVAERQLTRRFPSLGGYRILLVDAPIRRAQSLRNTLTAALSDVGLACTTTRLRLAEFRSVENTYLTIFLMLGGLGVLLGSAGMGIVAARNILERRPELALLRAVGFRRNRLRRLLILEHGILAVVGVAIGAFAAMVAATPALRSPAVNIPWNGLACTVAIVLIGSLLWIVCAVHLALRGRMLPALRNE